jgi:hypothetical protein
LTEDQWPKNGARTSGKKPPKEKNYLGSNLTIITKFNSK